MILCVVQTASKHSPIVAAIKRMSGKSFNQVINIGMAEVWSLIQGMLAATKRFIEKGLHMVDDQLQTNGNPLSAKMFNKLIIWGMHDFSAVEPSLVCLIPMVKQGLNMPIVKKWEQRAIDDVNGFFKTWVLGEGNKVWEWVMEKAVNGLPELLLGKEMWHKIKESAIKGILAIERKVNQQVIDLLNRVDKMKPGDLRMEAIHQIQLLLKGTFQPKELLTVGFEVVQEIISSGINKLVAMSLPTIWDMLLNWVSAVILPAITFGLNEATASGSCATGWISTVTMNIVQAVWEFIQVDGRSAFMYVTPMIVSQVVHFIFNTMFTLVVKPAAGLLAPIGKFVTNFMNKIKSAIIQIEHMIPPGIMSVLKTMMTNIFKLFMKQLSPQIGKSSAMSREVARALVQRERIALAHWMNRTRAPTPPPTLFKVPMGVLEPEAPAPTPSPTAPTPPPTTGPTSLPTPDIDWTDQVPKSDDKDDGDDDDDDDSISITNTDHDEDVDQSDVLPPEVPSAQSKHYQKKAVNTDPVYKHLNQWLKGHKEINHKKKTLVDDL